VEYKSWLDLVDNKEHRADLARHIAAIANHGGGNVVFGFTDDLAFAGSCPYPKVKITRDLVSGITRKFLDPPVNCTVRNIRSAVGNQHVIVVVPPHGSSPICAKASGPGGKGIVRATYYIRKIGPESAPIVTPAEWAPLLRRCAMHARSEIVGDLYEVLKAADLMLKRKKR
jgi:predicted HTH transcriptional regulator